MLSAFSPPRASGLREPVRCRRRHGRAKDALRRSCDAMRKTNPCRPSNWRCRSRKMLGMRSHGAKARTKISPPVSLLFEFDLPIATIGVRRLMPKNGFSSNGPKLKASRPNIGFRPCRRTRPSRRSSNTPNCAGGSSGIIRNSNKNSASIITKDEGGAAFTTTWLSASQPMDSWSPRGVRFPPQASKPQSSKRLAYPTVIDPADPPIRPERHVVSSIASIRTRLARTLVRRLFRCPCCQRKIQRQTL